MHTVNCSYPFDLFNCEGQIFTLHLMSHATLEWHNESCDSGNLLELGPEERILENVSAASCCLCG